MLLALEQLFAHDSVGFLDEPRFQRLLPPLVAQLHCVPPPDAVPSLLALLPPELSTPAAVATTTVGAKAVSAASPDAEADPFGTAVVAALTRMAAAMGSDALYRPFNRAVRL